MLEDFLCQKPLYYDEIDYGRMPRIYEKVKASFAKVKIIHLVGTNAKGTTGRFLAGALYSLGFNVGHYTSPHILKFNERVWLNGSDADDATLEDAHNELQNILSSSDSDALSYFEYTTLLSLLVYRDCEYVVMEAGLGGEHDATAVFKKLLTLVTPISYDHEAFLGNSIEAIATTKLKAIQKNAIIATQKESEVYSIADSLATLNALNIQRVSQVLDSDDMLKISKISKNLNLKNYLIENLSLAIAALKVLEIEYDETHFSKPQLFGRLTYISENIIVDVGHNPLAAEAIRDSLKPSKYILVYNSYQDKDYKKILEILKPIVSRVEIISLKDKRVEVQEQLTSIVESLGMKCSSFRGVVDDEKYLVFGSFLVVEAFMRRYK